VTAEPDSKPTARFTASLEAGLACFDLYDEAQVAGRDGGTNGRGHLLTALSGGPDSTALALLAEHYARQRNIRHQAVIVDHGLRHESAIEASRVAARMQDFGIDTVIRRVDATPPTGGIQNWARDHRYAILSSLARKKNAALLVAHHKADQAETVFMRLSRGSGLGGLGGMQVARYLADIPVLRPLLEWGPQELIAVCRDFGCAFERDPSNHDDRFERVKVRQTLAALNENGQNFAAGLVRLSRAARMICQEVDDALRDQLELPKLFAEGYATVSLTALRRLPDVLWRRVVGEMVLAVGGGDHLPSQAAFSRLRSRLETGALATLGGCRFTLTDGGRLCWITDEPGRAPPRAEISASVPLIFAGVWRLVSPVAGRVRMLGDTAPPPQWSVLPYVVRQSLPIIETLDGRVLYPHLTNESRIDPDASGVNAMFLALDRTVLPVEKRKTGASVTANAAHPTASMKDGS
jgi:tRNA(Ile)-lysidine synthase